MVQGLGRCRRSVQGSETLGFSTVQVQISATLGVSNWRGVRGPPNGNKPPSREALVEDRVSVFEFRFLVSDFRFRVSNFEFQVSGFDFRVPGFGFRVSGSGF